VVIRIDFGNADLVSSVLEDSGELFVNGGKVLAVTAPWSKEFYEGRLARLEDDVIEVGGFKVDDGGCCGEGREQRNGCRY